MKRAYFELYTYEDYKKWEGEWELIEGVAYAMTPSPSILHQILLLEIAYEFRRQIENCPDCLVLIEEDWKIDEYTVVKPDVIVVCGEKSKTYITKTPEIIVEVVSKNWALRDEYLKLRLYEREGVKYYVLVYPEDLKGKVYKLKKKRYYKEGDFLEEIYQFTESKCFLELDFGKIFKKVKDYLIK